MLQLEEVRGVPLFSMLPVNGLERLVHSAADLHLAAGDFAVHEAGERALYAVLSGKIEVVKSINGVERTLGWRLPGTIFGEVPLAFGTPFPGAYRAAEPSRVMRVDARLYYIIAAGSPEVAVKMGALARKRIGGLQGIVAADPPKARVTMFGPRWEADCGQVRRFLARNQITYDWVTPDSPDLATVWPGRLPLDSECPVLHLEDGSMVSRPKTRELARMLGLQTTARLTEYDTVIVGGGPAGLAAAVYGASEGLRTSDADTSWLPPEIARDARGYALAGDDVVRAGRWAQDRDPYLLEASTPSMPQS